MASTPSPLAEAFQCAVTAADPTRSLCARDEPPPSRWERVEVWLEFGGFAVLTISGLIVSVWNVMRYVARWF